MIYVKDKTIININEKNSGTLVPDALIHFTRTTTIDVNERYLVKRNKMKHIISPTQRKEWLTND